nr:hypothetical protein [Agromyces protaetiae]
MRHPHASRRDEPEKGLRFVAQPFVPHEQEVAQRVGQCRLVVALVDADELFDEERHALAAPEDVVDDRVGRRLAGRTGRRGARRVRLQELRELLDLRARQSRQFAPVDPAVALHLGEEPPHGMPPADVFGAVGQDDEHAARRERAHEEAQQRERRRVDPVEVFDDEDGRPVARHGLEEHGDRLVQSAGGLGAAVRTRAALGVGCRELGQKRDERGPPGADGVEHGFGPEVGDERAERGLDGRIRRGHVAEVDGLPREHAHVGPEPTDELGEQPGLADARLAAEQPRARGALARLVEQALEPREVCLPTHHL